MSLLLTAASTMGDVVAAMPLQLPNPDPIQPREPAVSTR